MRNFSATMYLMWTPRYAPNCAGSTCAVPVPLGSVNWSMCGGAVNTLNPNGANNGWTLTCASPSQGNAPPTLQFNAAPGYPEWDAAAANLTQSCTTQ